MTITISLFQLVFFYIISLYLCWYFARKAILELDLYDKGSLFLYMILCFVPLFNTISFLILFLVNIVSYIFYDDIKYEKYDFNRKYENFLEDFFNIHYKLKKHSKKRV